MATRNLHAPLLTVEDFLEIDFGPERKAELSNGVIRMMAGGTAAHNRIQRNVMRLLGNALRGTGCSPYGTDMGVRVHDFSLRYPDVSVFCGRDGPENDQQREFDDPRMVVEILSPSTKDEDIIVKLPEYKVVASMQTVLFIDPEGGGMRLLQRNGPTSWNDAELTPNSPVPLPEYGISLAYAEIFARD